MDLFLGLIALFFLSFFLSFYYCLIFFLIFNNYFFIFHFNIFLFCFILLYIYIYIFFLPFFLFLPFILSHVDDIVLVLWLGVRPGPLRWESRVQDIGPPETSQLHVISNGENLPVISNSTQRPSSTQRPASYSAGHCRPNN